MAVIAKERMRILCSWFLPTPRPSSACFLICNQASTNHLHLRPIITH
uniref:Uncharacterized protein n=1 Tax=Anguilla anguilla TaxID=7936 RepID=A0A0E9U8Y8_ANGAN